MKAIILFISGPEIFIVLLVVLLLFGSKKIPELAKGLGKGMREFKKATEDIKREINDNDIVQDVKNTKKSIEGNDIVKGLNKDIDDINKNLN